MALNRTWYTRSEVNISDFTTAERANKSILWGLKALMMQQIGTGTLGGTGAPIAGAAWTCGYSCDGAVAGTPGDAVDRWTSSFDVTKILHSAAGARSWFVLKSPSFGGSFYYVLVAMNVSTSERYYMSMSKAGFTGGTTTANPTATDEVSIVANGAFAENVAQNHKIGITMSSDGSFYFLSNKVGAGIFNYMVCVVTLDERRAGDAWAFWVTQNYSASGTGAPSISLPLPVGRNPTNSAAGSNNWTWGTQLASMPANWEDGKLDALRVIVFTTSTPGGIRGVLPDLVQICTSGGSGKSLPTVAAMERVTAGVVGIPWLVAPAL